MMFLLKIKKPFPHLSANGEKRNGVNTENFDFPTLALSRSGYKGVISARSP